MHLLRPMRATLVDPALADRTRRLTVSAIVMLALGLRLLRLGFQPLWWDEGWSLYFATMDIGSMLRLTAVDIHPPLYYLLLHLWSGLVGSSAISVRLLSVVIGTAAVPLLYVAGRRLFGEGGGLLAAALLALSPFHIYYSQEVRMYGLVTLLGLAAFALALRMEEEDRKGWPWLGYVAAATAALYTQYYASFLLLALNLVVLIRRFKRRRPLRTAMPWLSAQVAVVLLYLPWVWFAGENLLTYVRFKVGIEKDVPQGLFLYLGRHVSALNMGHAEGALADVDWLGLLPLTIPVLALAVVLLGRRARRQGLRNGDLGVTAVPASSVVPSFFLLLATCALLLVSGFAVNLVFPFNAPRNERQLLLALPAYLLLLVSAVLILWKHHRRLATLFCVVLLTLGCVSLGLFYAVPRYPDDDYRPVAERIRALGLATDAIVCVHPWQAGYVEAYLPREARPTLVLTPREVLPRERQLWADDPALMGAHLDALLKEHGRLWFPAHQAMGRVLEDPIETYLAQNAYPVLSEWYGQNTLLSLFAAGEPVVQPATARFGSWLGLEGVALNPGPLQAGWGVVAVELTWQLSERPTTPYTVGLRLVDETGRVWAQRDAPLLGGREPFSAWPVDRPRQDRHGLLVPAGTPPGDYRVAARVYRSDDVAVLPATFEGGSGGEVTLGTVRVVRPETPPLVEALSIGQRLRVGLDLLRLLGFSVSSDSPLLPGEEVNVDLFWQALVDPGEDLLPRLQLVDSSGAVVAERTEKPVDGRYPTAWWKAGELVRDPHSLPIPAEVQAGRYRLVLGLVRAADGQLFHERSNRTTIPLAEIEVRGREHRFEPTQPEHLQTAALGSSVELMGYDLKDVVRARGSPLTVTLHWHALQTPDKGYSSFVHLLDANGTIVAQDDGVPGQGELPALGWLPGEYLADTHKLQVPFDLPDGSYRLGVGLYDPATGRRLGERVLLEPVVRVSDDEGCQCP